MSAPERPLNIAFIGAGGITRAHLKAFERFPERLRVSAVCDAHEPAARALAEKAGGEVAVFAAWESLHAAVGEALDGVIVVLPHYLHEPAAAFFLRQGVPVLVEKPATCSVAEVRNLQSLERDGAFVQAGQMQRFNRWSRYMRELMAGDGELGQPLNFGIEIWQNINGYIHDKADPWILDGKRAGGGIAISVGIHPLDLLRFVSGQDFVKVTAAGRFDPPFINGAESSASVLFEMSGGLTGTMHASYLASRIPYSQRMVLLCERGTVCNHAEIGKGQYEGPWYLASGDPEIKAWDTQYSGFEPLGPRVEKACPEAETDPFVAQALYFGACIREGKRPAINSLEQNFNTLATIEAIARSLEQGSTVAVDEA